MRPLSQLLHLTILLPLWLMLAAVVLLSEMLDRRPSDEQMQPSAENISPRPEAQPSRQRRPRQEVVLTTSAAQV